MKEKSVREDMLTDAFLFQPVFVRSTGVYGYLSPAGAPRHLPGASARCKWCTVALLALVPALLFAGHQFQSQFLLFWALAFAAVISAGVIAIRERYQSGRMAFLFVLALALGPLLGFIAGLFFGWIG